MLLTFWLASRVQRAKMAQSHRYTVAVVDGTHWTPKAGRKADATFTVEGKQYSTAASAGSTQPGELIGRRFLVKFHPPQPGRYNSLYLDAPVPGYVTDVPPDGWAAPPFTVPARALE